MEEITIRDIARICGVGVSTVSRAINNHPDINPETKETIMRVIKENNYVPNNSARNLKRQDAKAIAVLVKGINNSFFSKNGHKDIAILCARKTDASIGKLRLEGYKKALKDNGIEVREELILPMRSDLEDYSLENGYMVTKEFLEKQIPCTAIFAISDMLAIGAGKALSDAGYKVPEDISLTGFDGVEIGKYVIPSLTTLKQPVDSMARETARILFDIIGKKAKHQHCVFDGELVVRDSAMPRA